MVQCIIDSFPPELPAIAPADFQLKICLEPFAISLLLQTADQVLHAAEYFSWTENDAENTASIFGFLKEKSKLFHFGEAATKIFFRTENVMLLPNELKSNARQLLQIQFGLQQNEQILLEKINAVMSVALKIDNTWAESLAVQFPTNTKHSSLRNLFMNIDYNNPDTIYLSFGNSLVELVAVFKNNLQLAKCFAYSSIHDLEYHLLNICKQLNVVPAEVQLKIQGFIEQDAVSYRSLQTFFAGVETINGDSTNWHEPLKALPAHYFTGLIQTA